MTEITRPFNNDEIDEYLDNIVDETLIGSIIWEDTTVNYDEEETYRFEKLNGDIGILALHDNQMELSVITNDGRYHIYNDFQDETYDEEIEKKLHLIYNNMVLNDEPMVVNESYTEMVENDDSFEFIIDKNYNTELLS